MFIYVAVNRLVSKVSEKKTVLLFYWQDSYECKPERNIFCIDVLEPTVELK